MDKNIFIIMASRFGKRRLLKINNRCIEEEFHPDSGPAFYRFYPIRNLCVCVFVSIDVLAKTMWSPTHVNIHSRANQSAPADRPPRQLRPTRRRGPHCVPLSDSTVASEKEKRGKLV